jgi:hypothetical protein
MLVCLAALAIMPEFRATRSLPPSSPQRHYKTGLEFRLRGPGKRLHFLISKLGLAMGSFLTQVIIAHHNVTSNRTYAFGLRGTTLAGDTLLALA